MPRFLLAVAVVLAAVAPARAQQPAASPSSPTLDYDFFKARVQPMFTTKRAGNARCVSCHGSGTPMRLQKLAPGNATWSEEDSRKNFEIVKSRVVAGKPEISRLLRHPLAESAGGDPHHDGGKHWTSKDDPEWQTLAAWVKGETLQRRHPRRTARCASSRPTAPATTSTSSIRRRTRLSATITRDRGGPRSRGRARWQPHLREQRSRQHARCRGRQDAASDEQASR